MYKFFDQGLERIFRVHIPPTYSYDTPYPLIISFHGWSDDENEIIGDHTVDHLSEERGFIIVAPRGLGSGSPDHKQNSWRTRGTSTGIDGTLDGTNYRKGESKGATCNLSNQDENRIYKSCDGIAQNSCSWTHCQADDIAFTIALLNEISSNLCID